MAGGNGGVSMRESILQDLAAAGSSVSIAQAGGAAATEGASSLRDVIQCHDKGNDYVIAQKGEFWVLYNYVTANRTYACHESVTYTTHADFTFLDNLQPLIERWRGPISLALYAPGTDFASTLASIRYLRKCSSPLISEYVTFHVYFEAKHLPKTIPKQRDAVDGDAYVDCSAPPPWQNVSVASMYRSLKKLLYPVNVGRNVARDSATTHYILASDIELYPSPGIIGDFLEMIRRQEGPLLHDKPKVFPLCLFEVESYATPPNSKEELVSTSKLSLDVVVCSTHVAKPATCYDYGKIFVTFDISARRERVWRASEYRGERARTSSVSLFSSVVQNWRERCNRDIYAVRYIRTAT